MGNRNAVGKKGNGKLGKLAIVFVYGSFCPVDYFVLCASIFIYTVHILELNMPCLNPPLDPSLPHSHTHLYEHIVAASAASSASIYNVVQTEGFLCPRRFSNRRFHASQ